MPAPYSIRILERWNLLAELWHTAYRRALPLALPSGDSARAMSVLLHGTVLEMSAACLRLFEQAIYSPIPILIRTGWEALIEQLAIKKDARYVDRMLAASIKDGRDMPDLINRAGRGMLDVFLSQPGARDFLRALKDEERKLELRGGVPLETEDKFKEAGVASEYTMYRFLSGDVHNYGGRLRERHVVSDARGHEYFMLFKQPSDEQLATWLDMTIGNLIRSSQTIHDRAVEFDKVWRASKRDRRT